MALSDLSRGFVPLCDISVESPLKPDSKHASFSKPDDSEDINSPESEFQQL